MGGGNVPFAGGVMSGNLGQQTTPGMGRMNGPSGGVTINVGSGPPEEKPPGQPGQPGQAAAGPGGMPPMPPQQPMINPQAMMDVYNAYFASLIDAVKNGKSVIGGIY
jgi:hypothetical protein